MGKSVGRQEKQWLMRRHRRVLHPPVGPVRPAAQLPPRRHVPRHQAAHPHRNNSAHVHPVLLIDEAHLLSTEILSEIRLLTNFQVDSFNALTVILCGSENLTRKFGLSVLEALASSITVTISVDTLTADESFSFVDSRMRDCGAQAPVFTNNALTLLHQAAGRTLRTLGSIANATLLQASIARSQQVEAEHVQQVIQR